MEKASDNRQRVIAALAVLNDGGEALGLLDYMADDDRGACADLIDLYAAEEDPKFTMEQIVRQTLASERFSTLAEVHPAWILEHLKNEPPRVIGIILRSLPSRHVRYVLKHLPPMIRETIPDMVESFAVAGPVLDVVRRRFESHFLPMRATRTVEKLGFEHLYYLKGEELEELIRELGLSELAVALSGMSGKVLHAVFNRLDLKDARRLRRRMDELKGVPAEFVRQARFTVLEVEGRHVGPDRMLAKIGLSALAASMDAGDARLVRLIQQKLDPADAYLLKRYIDERSACKTPGLSAIRREVVLDAVAELAGEGRIDPSWSRFRQEDDETPSDEAESIPPSFDEETSTLEQLA